MNNFAVSAARKRQAICPCAGRDLNKFQANAEQFPSVY